MENSNIKISPSKSAFFFIITYLVVNWLSYKLYCLIMYLKSVVALSFCDFSITSICFLVTAFLVISLLKKIFGSESNLNNQDSSDKGNQNG